jgi:hypothetical protein
MRWCGSARFNGVLLSAAEQEFGVMVTMDRSMEHQEGLPRYDTAVVLPTDGVFCASSYRCLALSAERLSGLPRSRTAQRSRSIICDRSAPEPMTQLLEKAFKQAAWLPNEGQDEFARLMLAELDSERRWADLFARPKSENLLERLADEALADHREGRTRPLDPTKL